MTASALPAGFAASRSDASTLIASRDWLPRLREAGLDRPADWQQRLVVGDRAAGRGLTVRLCLPGLPPLRLKQMRRGGAMAPLLGDRFAGSSRLLANLGLPVEALRRGIPTASPVALLLHAGPPGWFRAWIAFEELAATEDLMAVFRSDAPPTNGEISAAMRVVGRMHDEGIEHPDLNLGNLLVRRDVEMPEAWIIDLDGARLAAGPLDLSTRLRGVRRLERSYLKGAYERGAAPNPSLRRIWYERYESSLAGVAEQIHRAPGLGSARLWFHRLGWRR